MPFTGEVDISGIIDTLGDGRHGLRAGARVNTEEQTEHIYRATFGQDAMSTNMALEAAWELIWDVNGYYRALGIGWRFRARKIDLRLAYQAANGQDSEYLTYVLKQLLDREIRAQYDKRPLGHRMRDKYVLAAEMRALAKVAAEMSGEEGNIVTTKDVMDQYGSNALENDFKDELTPNSSIWDWGYYLWKSRKNEYEDLVNWQIFLTRAHQHHGLVKVISIGYIGEVKERFVVKTWNGKTIYFLNDEQQPSQELAETAVSNSRLHNGKALNERTNPREDPSSRR